MRGVIIKKQNCFMLKDIAVLPLQLQKIANFANWIIIAHAMIWQNLCMIKGRRVRAARKTQDSASGVNG